MKRLLFLIPVLGFCQPPDGGFAVNLSASQTTTVPFNNQSLSCTAWQITYTATGLTSLSLLAQQAPAGPIPSGFTTYAGIVQQGSNPNTSTVGAVTWLQNGTTVVPWFQLQATGLSGGGTISGTVYCWRSNAGPPIINPGSGTVTNFSSGNLTPLFTTLVTSSTLTPNLTFSPISQSSGLFFASPASASGNPIFRAIVASDIPTLNQNTTGQSGTTLALASTPTLCTTGQAPTGILASGNATGCASFGNGTVTNTTSGNFSPLFNVSVATGTTTPAFSFVAISQSQNLVYASPNGSSGNPAFRALVGADLPNPSASTLGGVQSIPAVTHKWINTISTSGVPGATQPGCADLSDLCGTINGGTFPASANVLASNSSSQPISATAHNIITPQTCAAASASGTAYTCSTSPTFTPAAKDVILFCPDVANTGSATLNVNSSSAATIMKQQGQASLVANDLRASPACVPLEYDGTNWNMLGQGGNASGSSSVSHTYKIYFCISMGGSNTAAINMDNITTNHITTFAGSSSYGLCQLSTTSKTHFGVFLPSTWTGSPTMSVEIVTTSAASGTATIQPASVCSSNGTDITGLTFNTGTGQTVTPPASGANFYHELITVTFPTTSCSAGQFMNMQLAMTANSSAATIYLVSGDIYLTF